MAAEKLGDPPETNDKLNHKSKVTVDMGSHIGLRGAASMWIVLFHCLQFCTYPLDPQGGSIMPLFMMLSGFTLALVYGSKPWRPISFTCKFATRGGSATTTTKPAIMHEGHITDDKCRAFDCTSFYWNRFVRIMPSYWLCNSLILPPVLAGYCLYFRVDFARNLLISIFPVATLLNRLPLDGPSWTVQTLLWFWVFFPYWLSHAQRISDKQLIHRIVIWYFVQGALTNAIFFRLRGLYR